MDEGLELEMSLDFGRGPATVHFNVTKPSPGDPPNVAIRKVLQGSDDITDDLTENERDYIQRQWSPSP